MLGSVGVASVIVSNVRVNKQRQEKIASTTLGLANATVPVGSACILGLKL